MNSQLSIPTLTDNKLLIIHYMNTNETCNRQHLYTSRSIVNCIELVLLTNSKNSSFVTASFMNNVRNKLLCLLPTFSRMIACSLHHSN